MSPYKIAILLTTYNSSRYLKELLDSLLTQTYRDWELFIHDDTSNDDTLGIIRAYENADQRIHLLEDTVRRGSKESFLWLMEKVEADFYMFCDHDDVWLPNKVELSLKEMLAQPKWNEGPIIVASDLKFVDERLNVIEDSFWRHCHTLDKYFSDKRYYLFYNNIPGCSMLFNDKAKRLALPCPPNTYVHDTWLVLSTLWNGGKVVCIKQPLMLYRQHSGNLIGSKESPTFLAQLRKVNCLTAKTREQYLSSLHFCKMSFIGFFLMKTKYLMEFHATRFLHKNTKH